MFGKITDTNGLPVASAKLTLEPTDGRGVKVSATTNKKGSYIFGLIRPGSYKPFVEAEGKMLRHLRGRATDLDKKEQWAKDGEVKPGEPPTLDLEDGYSVECDLTLGVAVEMSGANGTRTQMTPEQAVDGIRQKVAAGDCAAAMPEIRTTLTAIPDNALLHYMAGYCEAGAKDFDAAVSSLTKALELQPGFSGAVLLRGQVYARMGKDAEAEADFKKQADIPISSDQDKKLSGDAWLALGELYDTQGKDAAAAAAFEKVVELEPALPEPYMELSALYTKMGQPDKAAAILEKAKQAPEGSVDPAALLNVGISYLNRRDYEHAAETFQKVIDLGKKDATEGMAWGLLGRCQLNAGRIDEGVASLKKALELDPNGKMAPENRDILTTLEKSRK